MDLRQYGYLYNAAAHFAAQDKYSDGLIAALAQKGRDGFTALCWALEELSTQAELERRYMGHDPRPVIKAKEAEVCMSVSDILVAREIVLNAISRGLKSSDEPTEVDEILMETQKKTETA